MVYELISKNEFTNTDPLLLGGFLPLVTFSSISQYTITCYQYFCLETSCLIYIVELLATKTITQAWTKPIKNTYIQGCLAGSISRACDFCSQVSSSLTLGEETRDYFKKKILNTHFLHQAHHSLLTLCITEKHLSTIFWAHFKSKITNKKHKHEKMWH